MGAERGTSSFLMYLILLVVYFIATCLTTVCFFITAKTGDFHSRLWLWAAMLGSIVNFVNYIIIIIVAKEMYIEYKKDKVKSKTLEQAIKEDVKARVTYLQKEIDEEDDYYSEESDVRKQSSEINSPTEFHNEYLDASSSEDEDNDKAFKKA